MAVESGLNRAHSHAHCHAHCHARATDRRPTVRSRSSPSASWFSLPTRACRCPRLPTPSGCPCMPPRARRHACARGAALRTVTHTSSRRSAPRGCTLCSCLCSDPGPRDTWRMRRGSRSGVYGHCSRPRSALATPCITHPVRLRCLRKVLPRQLGSRVPYKRA